MGALEISLLLVGVICIAVSIIFVPKEEVHEQSDNVTLSPKQMEQLSKQVDEMIEEQISSLEEKTEISMDKISNRKILELSEYSDTVLSEINRNHEETMFLYDMLNEKTKEVKKIVSDFSKANANAVKESAEATAKVPENIVADDTKPATEKPNRTRKTYKRESVNTEEFINNEPTNLFAATKEDVKEEPKQETPKEEPKDNKKTAAKKPRKPRTTKTKSASSNNEKILKLKSEGMSRVDIAKTLGLGIGEVNLVIDLFDVDKN